MIVVILNPAAGTSHVANLADRLTALFEAAGAPARIVSPPSPAGIATAVRTAVAEGADVVAAVGGDGTVNAVASVLVDSETPLAVIPLGTLNHFAKDSGIPLDLERAVSTIAAGHTTQVDVGEVNGRIFLNNSSIGVYPDIVVERQELRRHGYRKWTAFAVAIVKVLRNYRGLVVRITSGESTHSLRTAFLFVGNNEYHVEGRQLGARDRLDSGRLFAYFAPRVHGRDLPKLLASAVIGRTHETLESFDAVTLRVETPGRRRLRVATDGEVAVMATPLHYRVRTGALRVIVPA
ncbi:MAG: diacylglycerol kinase family protein [Acidobacteriota bacterium]